MPSPSIRSRSDRHGRTLALLALGLVLSTATVTSTHPAAAADSAEVRKAREHYKNGDEAFKAGRFEDAYREWEAGYKLSGRALFLLNMAHAERRRGELHNARALYQRYLVVEPETKLRDEVEGVLKEIDAALASEAATARPSAAAEPAPPPVSSPPLALTPPPPEPSALVLAPAPERRRDDGETPLYRRWWVWAGAGALVAGGVLTALLVRHGDSYTRDGSLGTIGMAP
jgi:hypothetical protein